MSSEETRLWNIQSNLYFHVPVPKVSAQSSNTNLLIWQTSSDCDPLSIGSWVTQLWCLATQNPSLQTGEVFLFFFFFYWTIFLFYWTRASWQHFHSHHLERHWSHLHIQGDQWKSRLWQCWWQWRRWWKLPLDIFAGQPVLEVQKQSEAGEGRKSQNRSWMQAVKPNLINQMCPHSAASPKVINEMYPHSAATQRRYLMVSLESHAIWTQPRSPRPTTRCTSSRWPPSRCTSSQCSNRLHSGWQLLEIWTSKEASCSPQVP